MQGVRGKALPGAEARGDIVAWTIRKKLYGMAWLGLAITLLVAACGLVGIVKVADSARQANSAVSPTDTETANLQRIADRQRIKDTEREYTGVILGAFLVASILRWLLGMRLIR